MAVIYNLIGTSYSSFQVGKKGPTIYQGTTSPAGGSAGDFYIQNGSIGNQAIYQNINGVWTALASTNSPTLVTPSLGVAIATSINGLTITTTTGTLTIASGKTATINNTLTLAGTDSSTITFQGTDTYVGRATTDTLTNKTYDTAGTGNVFKVNGNQITAYTGTGNTVVLATSPTLVTPALGVATATTLTSNGFYLSTTTSSASGNGFFLYATNDIGISISGSKVGDITSTGLNGISIGFSTPSTGSFTTLQASNPIAISSGGTGTATGANQNYVFAGPSSGGTGAPLFRLLVTGDLPSLSSIYLPIGGGTLTGGLVGTSASFSSLSVSTAIPVSSGGTGLSSTSQSYVFIGPTSGSGAPTWRSLISGDLPSLSSIYLPIGGGTLTGGLVGTSASFSSLSLTTALPISSGGIGSSTTSQNYAFLGPYSGGTGAPSFRAIQTGDLPSLSSIYLPLSGGTLTGALTGTTVLFTGTTAPTLTNPSIALYSNSTNGGTLQGYGSSSDITILGHDSSTLATFYPRSNNIYGNTTLTTYVTLTTNASTTSSTVLNFASTNTSPALSTGLYVSGQGITDGTTITGITSTTITLSNSVTVSSGVTIVFQATWSMSIKGATSGTSSSTLRLTTSGVQNSEKSSICFFSTFGVSSDYSPRHTADILGGFGAGTWGNEFLSFNVGLNGSGNDSPNLLTQQLMRLSYTQNGAPGGTTALAQLALGYNHTPGSGVMLDVAGSGLFSGQIQTTSNIIVGTTSNTSGGTINLYPSSNATASAGTINVNSAGYTSFINFNSGPSASPSCSESGTNSAGTRIILVPALGTNTLDYAIGVASNELWSSLNTTSSSWTFYAPTGSSSAVFKPVTLTGLGSIYLTNNATNAAQVVQLLNSGTGSAAQSIFQAYDGSHLTDFGQTNSGFTTSNGIAASQGFIYSTASAGFAVSVSGNLTMSVNAGSATQLTLSTTGLNSTAIGATAPSTGAFTTLSASTPIAVSSGGTGLSSTSQNFVFAGPTSGSGAPTWRALTSGDIPSLSGTYLPLSGGTMTGSINFAGASANNMGSFNSASGFINYQNSQTAFSIYGTTVPTFQVAEIGDAAVGLWTFQAGSGYASRFQFGKSHSSTYGTQALVSSTEDLGGLKFAGSDGYNFVQAAGIEAGVDATPTAGTSITSPGIIPGKLSFSTTNTSGTSVQALYIDSAQNIKVGNSSIRIADSSGNLYGTSVTTTFINAGAPLQISGEPYLGYGTGNYYGFNLYYSSGWKYGGSNDYGYVLNHGGSSLQILAAPSGTAGGSASPTTAHTFDAFGNYYANSSVIAPIVNTGQITAISTPIRITGEAYIDYGNGNYFGFNLYYTSAHGITKGSSADYGYLIEHGGASLNINGCNTSAAGATGLYNPTVFSFGYQGNFMAVGSISVGSSGQYQIVDTNGYDYSQNIGTSITAAGTNQSTATVLPNSNNFVSSVSSGTGVALPSGIVGMIIRIFNSGANNLLVYPANGSGGQINALGIGVGYSLSTNTGHAFFCVSTTQWNVF